MECAREVHRHLAQGGGAVLRRQLRAEDGSHLSADATESLERAANGATLCACWSTDLCPSHVFTLSVDAFVPWVCTRVARACARVDRRELAGLRARTVWA